MVRAAKRLAPKYVPFAHEGVEYVVDVANREVMRNWVAIDKQAMPRIVAACLQANPQPMSA